MHGGANRGFRGGLFWGRVPAMANHWTKRGRKQHAALRKEVERAAWLVSAFDHMITAGGKLQIPDMAPGELGERLARGDDLHRPTIEPGEGPQAACLRWICQMASVRNALVNKFSQQARGFHAISCGGLGCNGCCYQLPIVHLWEGMLIARWLSERHKTPECAAACERILDALKVEADLCREVAQDKGSTDTRLIAHRHEVQALWFDRRAPCPLLGADGECIAYEVRPVVCSTYMVKTPPELCYQVGKTKVSIINALPISLWAAAVDLSLTGWLRADSQGTFAVMSLATAVALGTAVWTEGPAALKDWVEHHRHPQDADAAGLIRNMIHTAAEEGGGLEI